MTRTYKRVPAEEIRRLVREQGMDDRKLADELGISLAAAQRRRLRAGIKINDSGGVPRTTQEIALMGQLLDEGMSYRGVADVVGCEPSTVAKHFPGRGWTKKQVMEFAALQWRMDREIEKVWKGAVA